jgi:hypothetical protein
MAKHCEALLHSNSQTKTFTLFFFLVFTLLFITNSLSEYYGTKRMRIVLNGRKIGREYEAYYFESKAYFVKRFEEKEYSARFFRDFLHYTRGLF